ncbi:MAG: thiamine-phosphate kinase [Pirellula sp.]|jgi:thiamine-monophosphate kinase|nr:thiamine-phosphate kinase [Planctomycetota bacterium]
MEHGFIAWAKQRAMRLPKIKLGIGDDCALIESDGSDWVVTTDSLCEGTHFILAECGPQAVGKKLVGVNLSDLASMAARPVAVFLSLCLPRNSAEQIGAEIYEGVCKACQEYHVAIGGGDTNVWDGPLVVHLTAIGTAPKEGTWLRSGARPGDKIVVSGKLGGSLLGRHLDFEPRLRVAQRLHPLGIVQAATDISDGLGVDLLNITVASRCGAEVDLDKIPISDAAIHRAMTSGQTALEHAIGDGEDFELLLAVDPSKIDQMPESIDGVPLTVIGTFVSRTGLWSRSKGGVMQMQARGYVHG